MPDYTVAPQLTDDYVRHLYRTFHLAVKEPLKRV